MQSPDTSDALQPPPFEWEVARTTEHQLLKEFCLRVLMFGAWLVSAFALMFAVQLLVMSTIARDDRLGAIADKHRRLAQLTSPRLILVGGSNLAYGVNSARLENLTGRQVVNMAVQGSLGARFMVAEVAKEMRQGDVIYVALEYEHFFRLPVDGEATLLRSLTVNPRLATLLTPQQALKLVRLVPEVLQENVESLAFQVINPLRGRPNLRFQFDRYGDFVGHQGRSTRNPHLTRAKEARAIQPDLLTVLRDFDNVARAAGAQVVFGFPAVAESAAPVGAARIREALQGLQVVGQPADFVFPDSYFYDTAYHLLFERRDERTDRMAAQLVNLPSTNL